MRQTLVIAILFSISSSCSVRERPSIDEIIQNLADPAQEFNIKNDKYDTLYTTNGVRLIIPPKTFAFTDGRPTEGSIRIVVREVFNKSNMIIHGLGTTSNGRLLESYGMIELRATSGKEEMKIKEGGSISVAIPNKTEGSNGELFYGQESRGNFNWIYAGTTKDTTVVIETLTPLSNGLTSVKRTTYRFQNGQREFVSDTLFTTKTNYEPTSGDSATAGTYAGFPKDYEFKVMKLGWINCDRFIEISDKVDFEIKIKDYSQPIGYLVFTDINSVMQILFDESGKTVVRDLPNGYQVEIIVIDNIKGNLMWAKQNAKIGMGGTSTLETQKIIKDELSDLLVKLNQ